MTRKPRKRKARLGRTFWIGRDDQTDGQLSIDDVKMELRAGYFRTRFEKEEEYDAPNHEELTQFLDPFVPKIKPGQQMRVRLVEVR